jgi:hypothetical protein
MTRVGSLRVDVPEYPTHMQIMSEASATPLSGLRRDPRMTRRRVPLGTIRT